MGERLKWGWNKFMIRGRCEQREVCLIRLARLVSCEKSFIGLVEFQVAHDFDRKVIRQCE